MASDVTKMTRLVKIVSLLRQNVYPNHKTVEKALRSLDVAGVYNVSQKTIQRDVQYLRDMYAAPIAFDNGKRGYYLTDPEWKVTHAQETPGLQTEPNTNNKRRQVPRQQRHYQPKQKVRYKR